MVKNAHGKHSINSNYVLGKKKQEKKSEWKPNPEYLIELVIATEQICNCKKCGKIIKIKWVFVKEMKTWQ